MKLLRFVAVLTVTLIGLTTQAQTTTTPAPAATTTTPQTTTKHWYEKISLRGYAQFRYNRLAESNENYKCDQCDRSIGKGQGFSFRRARLVFSGNASERVFTYLQFDFASDASATSKHFLQVRDAYFDYALSKDKLYRVRVGQSKVPFGFENLQSSSNRLPLDRNDALNSAVPNERDLGVQFMITPKAIREIHKFVIDEGLKGAGDYGMLNISVMNGQTANKPELNNGVHFVGRFTYPFKVKGQIIEPGIQGYSGKYTIDPSVITPKSATSKVAYVPSYTDQRFAGTIMLYPQPFGVLAEYNVGKTPQFNPTADSIETKDLKGGHITVMYRKKVKGHTLIPFVRYHWFEGAKKVETDARAHQITETNAGIEWQIGKNLEITAEYMIGHRKYQDFKTRAYDEKGSLLRLQAQFSF
jgi:Phosphate-selective porin O and P